MTQLENELTNEVEELHHRLNVEISLNTTMRGKLESIRDILEGDSVELDDLDICQD